MTKLKNKNSNKDKLTLKNLEDIGEETNLNFILEEQMKENLKIKNQTMLH